MNIKEIAAKYSVSERTVRRYLKRGQMPLPLSLRRVGRDGKRYPPGGSRSQSPLHIPLAIARANIRRVARADSFYEADLAILQQIAQESASLLEHWERVTQCV